MTFWCPEGHEMNMIGDWKLCAKNRMENRNNDLAHKIKYDLV